MVYVRKNVWRGGKWNDDVLWYARGIQAMKARDILDPTSWRYQAAIHGIAGGPPTPPGAPWDECQHQTWFFLPWHRMYLLYFERIVRRAIVDAGGPCTWALPYWDYENNHEDSLPWAFRETSWPDGAHDNPLYVAQRQINDGRQLNPLVTSSQSAMNQPIFSTPPNANPVGFGGTPTGWNHGGGTNGALELRPHNGIHVAVGGPGGLMIDPNTAALDPIFWLHHANIDRLWEVWRTQRAHDPYPATANFRDQDFEFRDEHGSRVDMRVWQVLDLAHVGYTYEDLGATLPPTVAPATPTLQRGGTDMRMIGRADEPMTVTAAGGDAVVPVEQQLASEAGAESSTRWHLELADVRGTENPGVVYAVSVAPIGNDGPADHIDVGIVAFFGIELTDGGRHPLVYRFDLSALGTDVGTVRDVDVRLTPLDPVDEQVSGDGPRVFVGSVSVFEER